MRVIGIDPGLTGACSLFDNGKFVTVIDLPFINGDIDGMVLREWLEKHQPECAAVELVGAYPHFGCVSNFKLGHSLGAVKAVIAATGIRYVLMRSQKWKKFYGLYKTDKEASRRKALELFPGAAAFLTRKKDDNRAEAILIANCYATGFRDDSDPT
jgi:crossover junction endodeoxyribonuclease RuvC